MRPGDRVALCLRPGIDFFATTFALFKLGAVPVLIDPGIGLKNFGRCITQAEPAAFIGIPIVHVLRKVFGWAKSTNRLSISTGAFGGIPLAKLIGSNADGELPMTMPSIARAAIGVSHCNPCSYLTPSLTFSRRANTG